MEENTAWKLVRTNLRERDMTLAPEAVAWLAKLPWTVHPQELCIRYPRIANRMALVWTDAHLTNLYFDALLSDRRGGRRGFSTTILEELGTLRSYSAEMRGMASTLEAVKQMLLAELREIRMKSSVAVLEMA